MPGPEELADVVAGQAGAAPEPAPGAAPRRGRPPSGRPTEWQRRKAEGRTGKPGAAAPPPAPAPQTAEEEARALALLEMKRQFCRGVLKLPFSVMSSSVDRKHGKGAGDFWKLEPMQEAQVDVLGGLAADLFFPNGLDPRWIVLGAGLLIYGNALAPRIMEHRERYSPKPERKKPNAPPDEPHHDQPGKEGVGEIVSRPRDPVDGDEAPTS